VPTGSPSGPPGDPVSTPARRYDAVVLDRRRLSDHLVRLELRCDGLTSTGAPDEWVGLVVPGQFQSRYYTVRSLVGGVLTLDVVVHDEGLVTSWASQEAADLVDQVCVVTEPQGSWDPSPDARWVLLVGDLTALPAMARAASATTLPVRVWVESPDDEAALAGYLPATNAAGGLVEVAWLAPPVDAPSALAALVEALDWPDGDGYFWMAGESAQMRAIRKHLMRERRLPSTAYDVMGYWRGGSVRQPRAVDRAVSGA